MTSEDTSPPLQAPRRPLPDSRRPLLDSLPTGQRVTGHEAQARSVMVRRLRYILPALALVMVIIFLFNATGSKSTDDAFLEDFKLDSVVAQDASMLNPVFLAKDNDQQPYSITASSANQEPGVDNIINLNAPNAVMLEGERQTFAQADKGRYLSDDKVLELKENVTLRRNINGTPFILETTAAIVSVTDKTVTSNNTVTGKNNNNRLRADNMQVFNDEQKIVLKGNVLMRFNGKDRKALKKASPDAEPETSQQTPE